MEEKTPRELAEEILHLSHRYSELTDELGMILKIKDVNWTICRDQVTSDRQADRAWGRTTFGIKEREIEMELKKIQRSISSIKIYLTVKENEAKGIY